MATKASFSSPPVEKETTSILHPLPVISQSRNRHPLPFFERVITRDTMHANPDILDGNAISGRWEGRGQIPRRWIRLKNGLLEGDPEHPAKRIDDGAPHSPGASLLWFSHYRRRLDAPAPPSNSNSASFHIAPLLLSLLGLRGRTRPRASPPFLPLESVDPSPSPSSSS